MSIGVLVMVPMVVVGVLWTSVLLVIEVVWRVRQRHRIEAIVRRVDELMGEPSMRTGRHRLRSGRA